MNARGFHAKPTTAPIQAQLIAMPARIARSARLLRLHLPQRWPWEHPWKAMFAAAGGPPTSATGSPAAQSRTRSGRRGLTSVDLTAPPAPAQLIEQLLAVASGADDTAAIDFPIGGVGYVDDGETPGC